MNNKLKNEIIVTDEDTHYESYDSTSIGSYSSEMTNFTSNKAKSMIRSESTLSKRYTLSDKCSTGSSWLETSSGEFSEVTLTSTAYTNSSKRKSKSEKILTRPSKGYLGKRIEVLARSEWILRVLQSHPDVNNLRDRLTPLYRTLALSQIYKGKSQVPHDLLLQLIMQYLDYQGLDECRRILEKESKVNMKSKNIVDCRLITLIKLCIKDVEQIYELIMDKCTNEYDKETKKIILYDILSSMDLLDNQKYDNDVNIWEEEGENIIYEDDNKTVSMASLNRLIEKLTPADDVDQNFVNVFLATFTTFTSPDIFLKKLIQRYNYPFTEDKSEIENKMLCLPIQVRIINILKQWIEQYIFDFDDNIISNIRDFLIHIVKKDHPAQVNSLLDLLNNRTSFQPMNFTNIYLPVKEPKPIVPKKIFSPDLNWLDIDEEELARQFTLIEFDIFNKIRPQELLNQSWNKPKLKYRSPNITKMIKRFNEVSLWASSEVLSCKNLKQRAKILTKLINIADHLRKLNNFSTLMSFVAVFNSSSINRLKHTFSELAPKTLETLQDLTTIMDIYEGHREYKNLLESSSPPCIPYLGIYLSELVFSDEANEDIVGDLINFRKCRTLYSIITKIRSYQQIGYNLQSVYQIQRLLLNLQPKLDEKDLYKYSCIIEPRDAEKNTLQ